MFFGIAIGRSDAESASLISSTFETVHHLAFKGRLVGRSEWTLIDRRLPKLQWWRQWDTCERLRMAVADGFVRNGWPLEPFLNITTDRPLFEQLLDQAVRMPGGAAWLSRIRSDMTQDVDPVNLEASLALLRHRR